MANYQSSLSSQILAQLATTKSLRPSPAWLGAFLSTQRPNLPLPALVSTAAFRLLILDIKLTLDTSSTPYLPANILDVEAKERKLTAGPIVVQVLDIEDMSRSRWEQIEDIEADERGERTKGREIIQVEANSEMDAGNEARVRGAQDGRGGPHKLLLEDFRGTKIYGIELKKVEGVGLNVGLSIGAKLVLRDVIVNRGVMMLEPITVQVLGGKIEEWHKHWRENRKARLNEGIRR